MSQPNHTIAPRPNNQNKWAAIAPLHWLTWGALLVAVSFAYGESLSPAEARGKRIYREGVSPRGSAITALSGADRVKLEGRLLPCANCHGRDGAGREEGGLIAPNITWAHLIKPYGHTHPLGRTHGPFTEKSLAMAVTKGVDPQGNRLETAMPRYVMTASDLADLVAYIKRLETDLDPGVTDTRIRLGVLLPADENGLTMRAFLNAYFDRRNADGGYYGRKVELVFAEPDSDDPYGVRDLIERHRVFAILGMGDDRQGEHAELAKTKGVPLIVPALETADPADAINPYTFYLLAGIEDQGVALLDYALHTVGDQSALAIVRAQGTEGESLARRIQARVPGRVWKEDASTEYGGALYEAIDVVSKLRARGVGVVLYLAASDGLAALMRESARQGWRPRWLVPGALAGPVMDNVSEMSTPSLYLAYPTLPIDRSPEVLDQVAILAGTNRPGHLHVMAYAVAELFEEGVERAGRQLSRENLIAALETLGNHDTGLLPRMRFGRARRIGVSGTYVLPVNLGGTLRPQWIEPRESPRP